MVKRIGGSRRKSRHVFSKHYKTKGKLSISRLFQKFSVDDKVLLHADPSFHTGLYDRRFHSIVGRIKGMQGKCYLVELTFNKMKKVLIIHPIHLRKL